MCLSLPSLGERRGHVDWGRWSTQRELTHAQGEHPTFSVFTLKFVSDHSTNQSGWVSVFTLQLLMLSLHFLRKSSVYLYLFTLWLKPQQTTLMWICLCPEASHMLRRQDVLSTLSFNWSWNGHYRCSCFWIWKIRFLRFRQIGVTYGQN